MDSYGRVHPDALREAIARNPDDVALATVMWANNEIGTVMPVRELADVAAEFGVPLHADAVQAFGQVPVSFADSGLAAMTVSGHKVGGPSTASARCCSAASTAPYPCCTAAARSGTCAPGPSMCPPSPPSRWPGGRPGCGFMFKSQPHHPRPVGEAHSVLANQHGARHPSS